MKQTIETNLQAPAVRLKAGGDVRITARDTTVLEIETDLEGSLNWVQEGEAWVIDGLADLFLSVPLQTGLTIQSAAGDLSIEDLKGNLVIQSISGDVRLNRIGQLEAESILGDLRVEQSAGSIILQKVGGDTQIKGVGGSLNATTIKGDLRVENCGPVTIGNLYGDGEFHDISGDLTGVSIHGDAKVEWVKGRFKVDSVGGDLTFKGASSRVEVFAGGGANVELLATLEGDSTIVAGCDIQCQLPSQTDATVEVSSGGGDVCVCSDAGTTWMQTSTYQMVLGEGKHSLSLKAGGDVTVQVEGGVKPAEGKFERRWDVDLTDLADKVNQQVSRAIDQPEFSERLEKVTRRITEKLNAKLSGNTAGATWEAPQPPPSTQESKPPMKMGYVEEIPVQAAEDERLMILRMLQEKKLSIEEAEALLEALDQPVDLDETPRATERPDSD